MLARSCGAAEDEREEGLLLGYTEEQCGWWRANRFRRINAET